MNLAKFYALCGIQDAYPIDVFVHEEKYGYGPKPPIWVDPHGRVCLPPWGQMDWDYAKSHTTGELRARLRSGADRVSRNEGIQSIF
jgi:hypothetical protein